MIPPQVPPPVFVPGDLAIEGFESAAGRHVIIRYVSVIGVSYAFVDVNDAQKVAGVIATIGQQMTSRLIVPTLSGEAVERVVSDLNGKKGE